mgnify:FL=1
MMFNYDSFAKLRIFRNKAIVRWLNVVNAYRKGVCLRVNSLWLTWYENNVDKSYFRPNKQSFGHLGEQNCFHLFLYKINLKKPFVVSIFSPENDSRLIK